MLKSDGKDIYNIVIAGTEYVFDFTKLKGSATADANNYGRVIDGNADFSAIHLASVVNPINGDNGTINNGNEFTFSITNFEKITNESDKKYYGVWAVEIYAHNNSDGTGVQGWIPWDALQKMPNFKLTGGVISPLYINDLSYSRLEVA